MLSRFWHSLTWNRSTIWAPKQCPFFPDLGLYIFWKCFKPVILVVALCWQQKCFKWAILNKEFNRKKMFHHLQIQGWAVGPQDPHRWLTWNIRTRWWVQVLEPRLCSPPSSTPSRPSSEISTLLFSLCFSIFHYFELFLPCFSLFFIILICFFRIFLYFSLFFIVSSVFFSIFYFLELFSPCFSLFFIFFIAPTTGSPVPCQPPSGGGGRVVPILALVNLE